MSQVHGANAASITRLSGPATLIRDPGAGSDQYRTNDRAETNKNTATAWADISSSRLCAVSSSMSDELLIPAVTRKPRIAQQAGEV